MLRVFLGAAAVLLASTAGLSWRLDHLAKAAGAVRYLPPRLDVVQRLATDFESLLADTFWLVFLQYNGEKLTEEQETRQYENLWEGLTLIVGLDPRFRDAYVFGSWVLGDAGEADAAASLVRLGRGRNPGDGWYSYQLGFVEILYRRDLPGAIAGFRHAAADFAAAGDDRMKVKAQKMAANLSERHDQRDVAIRIWRDIHRTSVRLGDRRMADIAHRALARLGVAVR